MLIQALAPLPPHLPPPAALVRLQQAAPQGPSAYGPLPLDRLQLSLTPAKPLLQAPARLFGPPSSVPSLAPLAPATPAGQTAVAGKVSLDLLSLNVYGLPRPVGKQITERSAVIGASLGRYDIAALQETFSRDTAAIGKTLALNGLSYHHHKPTHHRLGNSGLEIFSKYPIISRDFKAFRLATDEDALAGKGVAFVRVMVPGVGPVDVYDTHYQANGDKPQPWYRTAARKAASLVLPGFDMSHEAIRLHDNQTLLELMRKHEQGYPTFVLGDFNANERSSVYRDLVQRLGLRDSFRQLNPDAPGYTSDGPANPIKQGQSQSRIDFIFYKPGKDVDVRPVLSQIAYNRPGEYVSDHFGVHTRFELVKK